MKKTLFGVYDPVRLIPSYSITETSKNIEILHEASSAIIFSREEIT